MKHLLLLLSAALLSLSAVAENISTIKQFKQLLSDAAIGWVDPIPSNPDGSPIVLTGRVCSSDESGNIYKTVYIQSVDDEGEQWTLCLAVNDAAIYRSLSYGQLVELTATGLAYGPYKKLMQIGAVDNGSITFLDKDIFYEHVKKIGEPEPSKVVATEVESIDKMEQDADTKWQSRLIKVKNVAFDETGEAFAPTTNKSRTIRDCNGTSMIMRVSTYADFANDIIPSGRGDITGILSQFGDFWQFMVFDKTMLEGFDEVPTPVVTYDGDGTQEKPYTVADVIKLNPTSSSEPAENCSDVWVEGNIVGYIPNAGGMQRKDIVFGAEGAPQQNIVLGPEADCKDWNVCIAVQLVAGDDGLRKYLSLAEVPANLGRRVKIKGTILRYFGGPGLKNSLAYEFVNEASIDEVSVSKEAEYFNLQGIKVAEPTGGLFIMRQGKSTRLVRR